MYSYTLSVSSHIPRISYTKSSNVMHNKLIALFGFSIFLCIMYIVSVYFNNNSVNEKVDHNYNYMENNNKIVENSMQQLITLKLIKQSKRNEVACYFESATGSSIQQLRDEEVEKYPEMGKNIFFLETSCANKAGIILRPRQACSIESAARMNPQMKVYLIIFSPGEFSDSTKHLTNQLKPYRNIFIRHTTVEDYVKNTPLEEWWNSGIFVTSQYPTEHMADLLRFLTLWKYPGIYLDLDVITTTPLENLTDFAGAEDTGTIATGLLGFGLTDIARKILNEYLYRVGKYFRGDTWSANGGGILTTILQEICGTAMALQMTKDHCKGFTVYPPSALYPVPYQYWQKYFERDINNETMNVINRALAVHVWNKLSNIKPIVVGDNVPYGLLADKHCPKIYRNCGNIF